MRAHRKQFGSVKAICALVDRNNVEGRPREAVAALGRRSSGDGSRLQRGEGGGVEEEEEGESGLRNEPLCQCCTRGPLASACHELLQVASLLRALL